MSVKIIEKIDEALKDDKSIARALDYLSKAMMEIAKVEAPRNIKMEFRDHAGMAVDIIRKKIMKEIK